MRSLSPSARGRRARALAAQASASETRWATATGPFRVQERAWPAAVAHRVELAEAWAASARRLGRSRPAGEKGLIAASHPANPRP